MDHFDKFLAEGETYLAELCARGQEESIGLEFKTSEDLDAKKFNRSDKRNLGKELSAFSNSMGGILVWGVESERGEDKVDKAKKLSPIANISNIYANVSEYAKEYLSPRNELVEVAYKESLEKADRGYLCLRIKRSDRRPHMSTAPEDRRYYKRIGDSAYAMEHYDIEDMMNRKQIGNLDLRWEVKSTSRSGAEIRFRFLPYLFNPSRVTANHPYLEFRNPKGFEMGRSQMPGFQHFAGGHDWVIASSEMGVVVNPGQSLAPVSFNFALDKNAAHGTWWFKDKTTENKSFEYKFGCQDRAVKEGHLVVSHSDLSRHLIENFHLDMDK